MVIKSGGITRFKFHLLHTNPHSNSKKCPNVPPEMKKEMRQLLVERNKAKAKKGGGGTMGGSHRHIVDDDDDDDDEDKEEEDDVYMYPAHMNLDERTDY